jgi:hypothetical protein
MPARWKTAPGMNQLNDFHTLFHLSLKKSLQIFLGHNHQLSNLLIIAVFLSPNFSCRSHCGSHHTLAHEKSGLGMRCGNGDNYTCLFQSDGDCVRELSLPGRRMEWKTDGPRFRALPLQPGRNPSGGWSRWRVARQDIACKAQPTNAVFRPASSLPNAPGLLAPLGVLSPPFTP